MIETGFLIVSAWVPNLREPVFEMSGRQAMPCLPIPMSGGFFQFCLGVNTDRCSWPPRLKAYAIWAVLGTTTVIKDG